MTLAEFLALPDVTPRIVGVEKVIEGRRVIVPTMVGGFSGALYQTEEDGVVRHDGGVWMVGCQDGQRVRRQMTSWHEHPHPSQISNFSD